MFISFIWFQPLDTFLYKILSGDLSTNFFFLGGVVIWKEQYDFSDMKNAIHLFEINIQFKKKPPQTRQKENKNGGKRNERKVRKKKKKLVHSYLHV